MAARAFYLDELATEIAAQFLAAGGSQGALALALTCMALEVPVLKTLWGTELCSPKDLIQRVSPNLLHSTCPDPVWEPHRSFSVSLFALSGPHHIQ